MDIGEDYVEDEGGMEREGVKLRLLWPSTKDDFGVDRVGFRHFWKPDRFRIPRTDNRNA